MFSKKKTLVAPVVENHSKSSPKSSPKNLENVSGIDSYPSVTSSPSTKPAKLKRTATSTFRKSKTLKLENNECEDMEIVMVIVILNTCIFMIRDSSYYICAIYLVIVNFVVVHTLNLRGTVKQYTILLTSK